MLFCENNSYAVVPITDTTVGHSSKEGHFWLYSLVCFPGSSMLQYVSTLDLFLQLSIFYCMDNTSCLSEHLDCLFAVVSSTMGTCAQVVGCTSFLAVLGNHILSGKYSANHSAVHPTRNICFQFF